MNLFEKILKRKPNTILYNFINDNKKELSYYSFFVYFIPIIISGFIFGIFTGTAESGIGMSNFYLVTIGWYFVSLALIGDIKNNNKFSQILEIIICLPVYFSFGITYLIFKMFAKRKYPDVEEDNLPLYKRKKKIMKLKRRI